MSTNAFARYDPRQAMYHHGQPRATDRTRTLPPEILELIFMLVKRSDLTGTHGYQSAWIRITWVCRRWREIALQFSALWAPTPIMPVGCNIREGEASHDPFDAARVLLARALPRPLNLIATPGALQVVRQYAHRVKSLRLEIWYDADHEDISPAAAVRALPALGTILTHLTIESEPERRVTIYAAAFPVLQFLSISHAAVKVVGIMTNLEALTAKNLAELPYSDSGRIWTHQDLKDLLAAAPNVKALTLDNAIPERIFLELQPLTDRNPISLPRLRRLQLSELAQDVGGLLLLIVIPPEAQLIVKGAYWQSVNPEIVSTRQLVREGIFPRVFLPLASLGPNPVLKMKVDTLNNIYLRKYVSPGGPNQGPLCHIPAHWEIAMTGLAGRDLRPLHKIRFLISCCEAVLHELHCILSPSQLHALSLDIPSMVPVTYNWANWLKPFTNLSEIALAGSGLARDVIQALESDVQLLPSLKTIAIWLDTSELAPSASALERWLQGRAQCGKGLTHIWIGTPRREMDTRAMAGVVQRLISHASRHVQIARSPYT